MLTISQRMAKRAESYGRYAAALDQYKIYRERLDEALMFLVLPVAQEESVLNAFYFGFSDECALRGIRQDHVAMEDVFNSQH